MTTLSNVRRRRRSWRAALIVASALLATAVGVPPRAAHAFSIGPMMHLFLGHSFKGGPHHASRGPHRQERQVVHSQEKERPKSDAPTPKAPEGPIFSAAR